MKRTATIKPCRKEDIDPDRPRSEQRQCLYTKDGKKLLGRHPSIESAKKQEAAIQVNKHGQYLRLAEIPEAEIKALYNTKWGENIMKQLGEDFPVDAKSAQFLFFSVWNAVLKLMDKSLQTRLDVDTSVYAKDPTFLQSMSGLAYFVADDAIKSSLGIKSDSLQKATGHLDALLAVLDKEADVQKTLEDLKKQAMPIVDKVFDQLTQYLKEEPQQKAAKVIFASFVRQAFVTPQADATKAVASVPAEAVVAEGAVNDEVDPVDKNLDRIISMWANGLPKGSAGPRSIMIYSVVAADASNEEWLSVAEAEGLYIPASRRSIPYLREYLQDELNQQLAPKLDDTKAGACGRFAYVEQDGTVGLQYSTPAVEDVVAAMKETPAAVAPPTVAPPAAEPLVVKVGAVAPSRTAWGRLREADAKTNNESEPEMKREAAEQEILPESYAEVIDVDPKWHSMGKFDHFVDQVVYEWTLEGGGEALGDADTFGYYELVEEPGGVLVRESDGEDWFFASAIVSVNSQGFVNVEYFNTIEEGREVWSALEEEYSEWLGEAEDEFY
jgi:hypothetical protein